MHESKVFEEIMPVIPCFLCYIKENYRSKKFKGSVLGGLSPFAQLGPPLSRGLAELACAYGWLEYLGDDNGEPIYELTEKGEEMADAYATKIFCVENLSKADEILSKARL